jgi:hypothetical protein
MPKSVDRCCVPQCEERALYVAKGDEAKHHAVCTDHERLEPGLYLSLAEIAREVFGKKSQPS